MDKNTLSHTNWRCKYHIVFAPKYWRQVLVEITPKYKISQIMGYLKEKSSLIIFDRHANLKYKYGNRHFWCRGYYVDTTVRNE